MDYFEVAKSLTEIMGGDENLKRYNALNCAKIVSALALMAIAEVVIEYRQPTEGEALMDHLNKLIHP